MTGYANEDENMESKFTCETCPHYKPYDRLPWVMYCKKQQRYYDRPYGCIDHPAIRKLIEEAEEKK